MDAYYDQVESIHHIYTVSCLILYVIGYVVFIFVCWIVKTSVGLFNVFVHLVAGSYVCTSSICLYDKLLHYNIPRSCKYYAYSY